MEEMVQEEMALVDMIVEDHPGTGAMEEMDHRSRKEEGVMVGHRKAMGVVMEMGREVVTMIVVLLVVDLMIGVLRVMIVVDLMIGVLHVMIVVHLVDLMIGVLHVMGRVLQVADLMSAVLHVMIVVHRLVDME